MITPRRMAGYLGLSLGIVLSIFLTTNNVFNFPSKQQIVLANPTEDHFIFLPITLKPDDPEFKIVFASDRERAYQVYDIYTMNIDGDHVQNLTNTPNIPESHPIWSPDGTMIAYLSGEYGQEDLFIMNADGSNKHNVSNTPAASERNPVWSPDSSKLGFISDRDDQDGIYDVFVVNLDGSGLINLTNSTDADEWSMDWSPNGAQIVYLGDTNLSPLLFGHIVTMNADGSNKNTIFTYTGFNYGPVWAPNSSNITFFYFSGCLAMIKSDGSDLQPCFTEPPTLDGLEGFKWDHTGSKLAFSGFINQYGLKSYLYDQATGQTTDLTPSILGLNLGLPFDWTTDNTQIIFGNDHGNGSDDISIINSDGTGYKNLTNSVEDEDRWPDLSPIMLP